MSEQRSPRARGGAGALLANSSLRVKTLWALGITMGLFTATAAAFLVNQQQIREARRWTDHTNEVIAATDDLLGQVLRQESNLRGYVATRKRDFLAPYDSAAKAFDADLGHLLQLTTDNVEQQARFRRVGDMMQQWRDEIASVEIGDVADDPTQQAARAMVATGRGKQLTDAIHTQIKQAADAERALLQIRERMLSEQLDRIRLLALASLAAGFLFCVLALVVVQRSLATPLRRLTELVGRLTAGDLDIDVSHTARGDELGAIARAIESFREASQQVQQQEWLKRHVGELSSRLSAQHDFNTFADATLRYLCPLIGAGYGVIFHADGSGAVEPIGGYGYKERRGGNRATHEGLAAQCTRDGQAIVLSSLPADYLRIASGLGEAPPSQLTLWPLPGTARIVGVLEIASFAPLSERERLLLAEAAQVCGLALDALGNAMRTHELLDQTRAQAEELQASEEALRVQQEELRTTNEALAVKNETLEQQGNRLRASEEELRVQAEELRTANEQLGEKSRSLNEFNERLQNFQKELETKNRDLEQASRYKSEFLANMSHELRTPLNSLLILAKDLADNGERNLSDEQVEAAQIIHDSGRNLLGLINDILDLSKIEAGRMDVNWEEVSPQAVAGAAERTFRRPARERELEFTVSVAEGLPPAIRSDAAKINQIVTNLLGNAFKFTHAGHVRLTIARPDATQPLPNGLTVERTLALTVADSGSGIGADKLARLFQPFEQGDGTTSRRYGGTGLGLSISRALAQMLGGDIVVRSTPQQGSCFTLLLPEDGVPAAGAAEAAAATAAGIVADGGDRDRAETAPVETPAVPTVPPAPETISAPASRRPSPVADDRDHIAAGDTTMLIVEDDGAFARVLADITRRKGYRVLVAGDGESGLALAQRYRPHGILLDVDLPGMSGWSVMERLKADPGTRHIPVHFVTATDEASRGLAMGAVGFLTKPATREALDTAFQRVLHFSDGRRRRLLVVDDDASARLAIRRLLASEPVDIVEADTAAAGLATLAAQPVDCIVLDLSLPDASGFEFLERLAMRGPVPPVVIYSARDLTRDENLRLREYTDSIVIKGAQSPGRLLDEVSLFLHAVRKPEKNLTSTAQTPSGLAGRTVLIVDDDMRNIFALSKALRGHGLTVLVAQDGERALRQLEQHNEIDWVLMDVMMPGMDGYETTREIRKNARWRELPVIMVTAKAMPGDREKSIEAGASDYLTKPIDMDRLLSTLNAWLRGR